MLSKGANVNAKNGVHSIFRLIVRATADNVLDDPLTQIERFIRIGAKPQFSDIISFLKFAKEFDDDTYSWSIKALENLLKTGEFNKTDLEDLDTDELEEMIEEALESAPEITEKLLGLLKSSGLDVEALVA